MPTDIDLDSYLAISEQAATEQWRAILDRVLARTGKRQAAFLPVETLLCFAASLIVDHRRYGSSSAPNAKEPVPALARLFKRPNSSILAKMANLDGSRAHGARFDQDVALHLGMVPELITHVYLVVLEAARSVGIGSELLPDFLELAGADGLQLLGQDELRGSDLRNEIEKRIDELKSHRKLTRKQLDETERVLEVKARIGQHRFSGDVLRNCGYQCVFCGFKPDHLPRSGLIIASHIKAWRSSSDEERLDVSNGLAACPTHDAAFDVGLLFVNGGLHIHESERLRSSVEADPGTATFFGRPPIRAMLLLPATAVQPGSEYLAWHRANVASI